MTCCRHRMHTAIKNASPSVLSSQADEPLTSAPRHFPTKPLRIMVVGEFAPKLNDAVERLTSDGLVVDGQWTALSSAQERCGSSSGEITTTIKKIEKMMELCDHALHCSHVYMKPVDATVTYVRMMDVRSYLHKLLANEAIREPLIKHFNTLEKILSHPACEVIPQINFDADLMEVSGGICSRYQPGNLPRARYPHPNMAKCPLKHLYHTTVQLHHSPISSEME